MHALGALKNLSELHGDSRGRPSLCANDQPAGIQIFPRSPAEYFWKVVNAHITFVKDDEGKVIKAMHQQGGTTIQAPKIE